VEAVVLILALIVVAFLSRAISSGKTGGRRRPPKKTPAEYKQAEYKQGYFTPRYPEKYRGDAENIIYRSGWEETAFHWCDMNRHVVAWASEELAIPYFMKGVGYRREYYPDLLIYFSSGETVMVEIKPGDQKARPNYENRCKWAAARSYCRKKGWAFRIWDEETIEKLRPKIAIWQRYH